MAIDSAAAMIACELQPCILIADDQSDLLDALRLLLKGEGHGHGGGHVAGARSSAPSPSGSSICC